MGETPCPKPNRPKRRKPGFNEDMFKETSYYFKDSLRWVYPYPFTFTAYVKQRWLNLTILELYSREFHMETIDYYKRAIRSGKIKINNKTVAEGQRLINNDILRTMVHRHEPPVAHQEIEFIRNDDEMVVINKPPSIPVHPCGRYRHNTIVFLLGKEHGLQGLHTIHRIDRLTSGVLMFAKTVAKAKDLEDQIHKKQCIEKEYFARVVGEFPVEEIVVDEPVLTASHKIGVCHVHDDGKPCSTKFKRLSFNGKSSVVSCKPLTGRMHQIRVHLQWLGFPIVNDPIYNHPTAWGDKKRKRNMNEVIQELLRTRKDKSYETELSTDKFDSKSEISLSGDRKNDIAVVPDPKRRKVELSENTRDEKVQLSENTRDEQVELSENTGDEKGINHMEDQAIEGDVKNESVADKEEIDDMKDEAIEDVKNENLGDKEEINDIKDEAIDDNVKTVPHDKDEVKDEENKTVTDDIKNENVHDKEEMNDEIDKTIDNKCNKELNDSAIATDIDSHLVNNTEENVETKSSVNNIDNDDRLSYTSLDIGKEYVDSDCTDCKRTWKQPLLSEMVMYLHSWHYKGPDWEYKTSVPEWAKEEWNED